MLSRMDDEVRHWSTQTFSSPIVSRLRPSQLRSHQQFAAAWLVVDREVSDSVIVSDEVLIPLSCQSFFDYFARTSLIFVCSPCHRLTRHLYPYLFIHQTQHSSSALSYCMNSRTMHTWIDLLTIFFFFYNIF